MNDDPLSPDLLLRRAAQGDAARAAHLLAYVPPTKLLDAVMTQAELAVDEDRHRQAGVDAIAELDRAAIEVLDLPQGADLELDITVLEGDPDDPDADLRLTDAPVLIGWELVTVPTDDLLAATVALPVRPWHLLLVAFTDRQRPGQVLTRHVVAAAADGRLVSGTLRFQEGEVDLLAAVVTRDPAELGDDAILATALWAALEDAARGA
jgi:hypothetical protein